MQIGQHDIRFDNIGSWPKALRWLIILVLVLLLLFLGYFFFLSGRLNQLQSAKRTETTLKMSLAQKQQIAINLNAYKKQVGSAQTDLQQLTRQLPTASEVPAIIEEISKLAQAAGLKIKLLEPVKPKTEHYYIEYPIHILLDGQYKQIITFINDLSQMQRIISIDNFKLRTTVAGAEPLLEFDFTAKTYRYNPTPPKEVKK